MINWVKSRVAGRKGSEMAPIVVDGAKKAGRGGRSRARVLMTMAAFFSIYSAIADVYFAYDPNQTRLKRVDPDDPESLLTYEFGEFNQLGVNLTLQARF